MFSELLTIGNGIVILLSGLIIGGLFYFKKTALIKSIIYQGVLEADEYFESSEGKKKAEYVLKIVKPHIPLLLRWAINEKIILKIIDEILEELKELFKIKEENKKDIQKKVVDKFAKIAKNIKFEEDGMIVHNSQIDIINESLNKEIDEGNGEVYGLLKADTNFKGDSNMKAEVGVRYKF